MNLSETGGSVLTAVAIALTMSAGLRFLGEQPTRDHVLLVAGGAIIAGGLVAWIGGHLLSLELSGFRASVPPIVMVLMTVAIFTEGTSRSTG